MPYDSEPINFDFTKFEEAFSRERWIMYRHMVQDVFDHVFPHRVEQRQVYGVTGDGPFDESDLTAMLDRAGLYEDQAVELLSELPNFEDLPYHYLIVGRNNFEEGLLDWALEQLVAEPDSLLIFSQEDFLIDWMFGRYEHYTRDDPRVWDHPGLAYLAENSGPRWPWPSTTPEPSLGSEVDANGWRKVHPLKARFGYTVGAKEGLTDQERWRRLDRALTTPDDPLKLSDVVNHIAWQVRWKKKDDARYFENAIAKWERDLEYLKRNYYKRQFIWPDTD